MTKALISSLTICAALLAAPVLAADEGYTLKADQKMSAVLKDLSGKRVTIHLRSGGDLTGKLAVVGDHAVQLSQLANKDFYDAIVAVDAIGAVEVKVRSQ
jgi:hypothetical protein